MFKKLRSIRQILGREDAYEYSRLNFFWIQIGLIDDNN